MPRHGMNMNRHSAEMKENQHSMEMMGMVTVCIGLYRYAHVHVCMYA